MIGKHLINLETRNFINTQIPDIEKENWSFPFIIKGNLLRNIAMYFAF